MAEEGMREGVIAGRNAVLEALKSGRATDTLYVAAGETGGLLGVIISMCREQGVVVKETDKNKLARLCGSVHHQGVVLFAAVRACVELDDLFALAKEKNEPPFFVICDEIEDPHNLGAIIRTAEAAGAHGVIVPKRRSAPLSVTVARASAGAIEYIPIARVPNLPAAIDQLKDAGLWVYGADMRGESYVQQTIKGPVALVIGSEGRGIGRLVRERCDILLSLPMKGRVNSLNASVAAGILLYEIAKHR